MKKRVMIERGGQMLKNFLVKISWGGKKVINMLIWEYKIDYEQYFVNSSCSFLL